MDAHQKKTYDEFLAFDPNKPVTAPWATYAQRRNVKFKSHSRRASALQVFAQYTNLAVLYKWEIDPFNGPGHWVEFATKDRETKNMRCEHCLGSTIEPTPHFGTYAWNYKYRRLDPSYGDGMYDTGTFVWLRTPGGKYSRGKLREPLKQMYVCRKCHEFMR